MKKKQKQQMLVDKENERRRLALTESINANSDIFNDDTDSDTPVAGWWKHSSMFFSLDSTQFCLSGRLTVSMIPSVLDFGTMMHPFESKAQ